MNLTAMKYLYNSLILQYKRMHNKADKYWIYYILKYTGTTYFRKQQQQLLQGTLLISKY